MLNDRQKKILKAVIDRHATENRTISSLMLSKTKELEAWSSATIRNDMMILEEKGYLKKEHFSSGKVPTKQGYSLYIESLMDAYEGYDEIKQRLLNVFSARHNTIDQMFDECASLISNFLNLPTILIKSKKTNQETLKKIDVVHMSAKYKMVYLITSSGDMVKDFVPIYDLSEQKEQDLLAAIRLLNEYLYDCPINEISGKLDKAISKLKDSVSSFEFIYETIISKLILSKLDKERESSNRTVYNSRSLTHYDDINVSAILELLDKYSTFDQVNYNYLKTGKTLFNLEGEVDRGFAVATTDIDVDDAVHKLAVVGPLRMNYSLIKYLFEFISEKIRIITEE